MNKLQTMQTLLEQEEALFQQFYDAASLMLTGPVEEMELQMDRRMALKEEIDLLEEQKKLLFVQDPLLQTALQGEQTVPAAYQPLRDLTRQIQGILYQVRQLEPQIIRRATLERDSMEKKIRAGNKSPAAHASRFMVGKQDTSALDVKIGKA